MEEQLARVQELKDKLSGVMKKIESFTNIMNQTDQELMLSKLKEQLEAQGINPNSPEEMEAALKKGMENGYESLEEYAEEVEPMSYYFDQNSYLFVACVVFVVLLLVFFGYKLYKSLSDKERRRAEKKQMKQLKKKK